MIIYIAKVEKDGFEVDVLAGKPMSSRPALERKLLKQGFKHMVGEEWEGKGKVVTIYPIAF